MRVATLNYHNAFNYGAVLQSAALQKVIEDMGFDCDIIDYRNQTVEDQYRIKLLPIKSMLRNLRNDFTLLPFIIYKKRHFRGWIDSYKKTAPISRERLQELNSQYDKFIVGSDQVWNMQCHNSDESFFLDFVKNKEDKIAYAASFGAHNIEPDLVPLYKTRLADISYISVRENRGAELVAQLIMRQAKCTMDPVLLVGKEYWLSRAQKDIKYKDYIFVYQLGHGKLIPEYVKHLKQYLDKKVIYVTGHTGNFIYYNLHDKNCSSVGPETFLSLLINSEYVVTNSFHATVLSVLFNKQFSSVIEGGAEGGFNSRIYSMLVQYNLVDRIQRNFDSVIASKRIDFSAFRNKYERDREESLNFLKQSILGGKL